jgi:hypothetical protein
MRVVSWGAALASCSMVSSFIRALQNDGRAFSMPEMPIGDKPELYSWHKHLISNVSTKNRIFLLDLAWTLVYPAATLQEVKTVEA